MGNTSQIIGQGGMLKDQTGGGTIPYRPSVILSFPNGTDGIVTLNTGTERVQSPRIRGVLISGSATLAGNWDNGKTGIKFQTSPDQPVQWRKVGLPVMYDVYVEHFGVGVDWVNTDSGIFDLGAVTECAIAFKDGGSQVRVTRSSLWRHKVCTWLVTNTYGSRQLWFTDNECEPDYDTPVLDWTDVVDSIVNTNNNMEGSSTFAHLKGASRRNLFVGNKALVTAYGIRQDPASTCQQNVFIGNHIGASGGSAQHAIDVSSTTSPGLAVIIGNTTLGVWVAGLRYSPTSEHRVLGNRTATVQVEASGPETIPDSADRIAGPVEVAGSANAPLRAVRRVAGTAAGVAAMMVVGKATGGEPAAGFGPQVQFYSENPAGVRTHAGTLSAIRNSAGDYNLLVQLLKSGAVVTGLTITPEGYFILGSGAFLRHGTGSPNSGAFNGDPLGSVYIREDDTTGNASLYLKVIAGANGWAPLPTLLSAPQFTATTVQLGNAGNTINTTNKYAGKQVWATSNRPVWASGPAPTDPWVDGQGVAVYTPS